MVRNRQFSVEFPLTTRIRPILIPADFTDDLGERGIRSWTDIGRAATRDYQAVRCCFDTRSRRIPHAAVADTVSKRCDTQAPLDAWPARFRGERAASLFV